MENLDLESIAVFLKPFVEALAGKHGAVAQILTQLAVIIGSARLFIKPIVAFLEKIVLLTPTEKDNAILIEVKKHPVTKVLGFIFDYVLSLKLPTKKVEAKKE